MITELYEKYNTGQSSELPELNQLNFILRKAELGKNLTDLEWNWLDKHQFVYTIKIIKDQENYRDSLLKEIRREFIELKNNRVLASSITSNPSLDSEIALTLYKVNVQERLCERELRIVGERYHKHLDFIERKQKYRITDEIPFDDMSEDILLKLEHNTPLSATDIKWIRSKSAHSFLSSLKTQFSCLQNKYKAFIHQELNDTSLLLLHNILQKLDENRLPNQDETEFLIKNSFTETVKIIDQHKFSSLKVKYKATQIQENNCTSHLYKVLKKLDSGSPLPESDINYLNKRKLYETVKFTYKKEADRLIHKIDQDYALRPDDIIWGEKHHFEDIAFKGLKNNFKVKYRNDVPESRLYAILKKLQRGNRLIDEDVIWLEGENLLQPSRKIYITYHTLEAQFYENEFQRTKNYWQFASASAQWRKAEKPENVRLKQLTHSRVFNYH